MESNIQPVKMEPAAEPVKIQEKVKIQENLIKRELTSITEAIKSLFIGVKSGHTQQLNKSILKYPVAVFPDKVSLDSVAMLDIFVKSSPQPKVTGRSTTTIKLLAPENDVEIPVHVIVEAGSFDVLGKYYATVTVPLSNGDSKHAVFKLRATKEGRENIHIRFFQQETYVGHIEITTTVVKTSVNMGEADYKLARSEWSSSSLPLPATVPPGPDITIIIHEKTVAPNFEYDVLVCSSEIPIQVLGPIRFPYDPEGKFRKIFEDIENTEFPPKVVDNRMRRKGNALYDELFPPALKNLYWEKRDRIKSIRVISKEPWIPWEIIKPWRDVEGGNIEEDEFLCERFSFARWLMGEPERIKTKLRTIKVIVPSGSNLPSALDELHWIIQFGNSAGMHVSIDSSYEQVNKTLEQGGFDILHFITHGKFNAENPLFSAMMLEKGILLRADDIGGTSRKFGKTNPVIILNACQTGSQGFSLTGIQSWATRFIDSGASVFIGTLWSVSDDIAIKFIQILYDEFSKGATLGEAVRSARISCKASGDPSWLAYQLYGHPNSKMNFPLTLK
jgi:hypothetical protein